MEGLALQLVDLQLCLSRPADSVQAAMVQLETAAFFDSEVVGLMRSGDLQFDHWAGGKCTMTILDHVVNVAVA